MKRIAADAKVREEEAEDMQKQGEAVGRRYLEMGFNQVRLWRGKWVLASGVLTQTGADALGVDGGTGEEAMLATQPVAGGWVMGLLQVGKGLPRSYIQGPGKVPPGKVVPYQVSVDGRAFFGYSGEGLPDGTLRWKGPQDKGKNARFRFGSREVTFDVENYTGLWWAVSEMRMPKDAVLRAGDQPEEKKAPPEPPPTLRLK